MVRILGLSFRLGFKNLSRLHPQRNQLQCLSGIWRGQIALVDNTYPGYSAQMWGRIVDTFQKEGKVIKIDVVVQNHVEKDHSGALSDIRNFQMRPYTVRK